MDARKRRALTVSISTLGVLLLLAGPIFDFLPTKVGGFAGIACFIISGALNKILKDDVE